MKKYANLNPKEARKLASENKGIYSTAGFCDGYLQCNLVILKEYEAKDFRIFAKNNPKPCPVLEIIDDGTPISKVISDNADITTTIPFYNVYMDGVFIEELSNITHLWEKDMVIFLIGCSLTFEFVLQNAGIKMKHIEQGTPVPMYKTSTPCKSSKLFKGNIVASMRPIKKEEIDLAVDITSKMNFAHGGPIHIGDASEIGIRDISKPDWGESVPIEKDEIPVFWACGVTPQNIAIVSKPSIMITHKPGSMFISDLHSNNLIKNGWTL